MNIRKIIALAMTATLTVTGFAQSKLDLQSRLTLDRERSGVMLGYDQEKKSLKKVKRTQRKSFLPGFVQLNGDNAKEQLEQEGVKIERVRGNIALALLPIDDVERIADMKCVSRVQLARPVQQKMDKARAETGIDKIQSGIDLPQAYTGKGVVCGIVDNGFDPNHVNFLKPDGTTRFGYFSKIYADSRGTNGYIHANYYPQSELNKDPELADADYTYPLEMFSTDTKDTYHGTHTLGIMAGSYKGKMTAAPLADDGTVTLTDMLNPYYGAATEAELVASSGDLQDYFIILGIEDCIAYAQYSNGADENEDPLEPKPCVINLSLGSNLGPHDKMGLMNQYLSQAGEAAIICMSAGNEADNPICLHKTFTAEDKTLKSFIKPMSLGSYTSDGTTYNNLKYGTIHAYSNDPTEFTIKIVIYNTQRGSTAMTMPVSTATNDTYVMWASSSDYSSSATVSGIFAKYFDGYVAIGATQEEYTGRYYAVVEYMLSDNLQNNPDQKYLAGIIIEGKDGQTVDVYGDDYYTYFDSYGKAGWENGTADGSISDMAVSDNVIVVGSYNTRDQWGCLDGGKSDYGVPFPVGDITSFSSYGTLSDGTTLPHICAPGGAIISSANSYFVENTSIGLTTSDIQGKTNEGSKTDYWIQAAGTSMATPVVSGAIALWLEADPTLKCSDILDIIKTTAVKDDFVKNGIPAQWGYGKFDAYAGLKEVLRRKADGIETVTAANGNKALFSQIGERTFRVSQPGAKSINVAIYNASGAVVNQQSAQGDEAIVDLSAMPKGIYIVRANNTNQKITIIK